MRKRKKEFMTDNNQQPSLKERTARGLFWGGLSNGIQQLLNLLFGIVLARLLSPADYGMVGMLAIFTALAGTLQESGFTMTLANKREVTHRDYNAVFWFSLLTGLTMYVILFFCAPLIADFYHQPELTPLARYLFLGFVMSSTATAHNAYLFRNLMVKEKTLAIAPALLVSGVVGIIMAMNGMAYWGIATQSLVYIAVVNAGFWYFSPWRPTLRIDFRPLREMFAFSNKLLATNIFTQVNNNVLSALLGRYFTVGEVGHYTQSAKWNTMGYSLVSGTLSSVAQPILARVGDDAARRLQVLRKLLRFTAFLTFPAMLGLALVAEELIVTTITAKWLPCVPILQWLCLWGACMPVVTLYSNLIISRGKSNIYMWTTLTQGLLQLLLMPLCYPYGLMTMIQCFVVLNLLSLFVWQYFVWRQAGLTLWLALKDIAPFAFLAAVTMVATHLATCSIENIYLRFGAKVTMAVALYMGLMWGSGAAIFRESVDFLRTHVLKRKK